MTHRTRIFALNPAAILMADQVGAMADLDPIWRDDPDIIGAKVNVSPMILTSVRSVESPLMARAGRYAHYVWVDTTVSVRCFFLHLQPSSSQ